MIQSLNNLKIIFFGTPEFSVIILEKLVKNNYRPILVITEPDRPAGRKQTLTPLPVKVSAEKYGIPILQPEKFQATSFKLQELKPDLIIVAAYGQIIPKEILEIPKYGCLNVHPSLLPKYRGASPIQNAILNGDKKTGVTIMLMDEKMDHGPIVAQRQLEFPKLTYPELHNKLAALGAELLVETVPKWIKSEIKSQAQDESKATYTKILKRENGKIDWSKSGEFIERKVRAFYGWPGTYAILEIKNKKLKILEADVLLYDNGKQLGEVFLTDSNELAVQTGQNCLIVRKLQLEGGKLISAQDFLRGHPQIIGEILK